MKLLITEDNQGLREQMKWALNDTYEIVEADSFESCIAVFKNKHCNLVCLDMGLDNIPDKGLEIIDSLLLINRHIKIVVITANTSETLGNKAISKGAFDFLKKPVDIDELKVILSRATRLLDLEQPESEKQNGKTPLPSAPDFKMIGECQLMKNIFQSIKKLSLTEVSVLITGESGTGKEVCAHSIHFHSSRKNGPFVPINCGAIPETLLESELFGYVKGAFTGANTDKIGLIESAKDGTLFLDEIGDMPKHLQAKLLRFLEDQKFQRLGDTVLLQADVRIIAATNRKGLSIEDNPAMRTDLYYRLSEFEINLPPLKDRENDIILLANHIISKNRERFNMPKLKLSSRSEQSLINYNWPGNVRELENKLSRATISSVNSTIEPEDLQLSSFDSYKNLSFKNAKNLFEKNYITEALKQANFKISITAKNINISRPTLYDMIKKHDIIIKTEASIK